jgi:histidinol dehydrogenase
MLRTLDLGRAEDAQQVEQLVHRAAAVPPVVEAAARAIVADVRARGDAAVREHTARIEGRTLGALDLTPQEVAAAAAQVAPEVRAALEHAAARIRAFHERQRPASLDSTDADGVRLGLRALPLARAGLYVPGGTARYPSSVLMTAVPARVAGVGEVIMTTPGPSPETLCAAQVAGVDRVLIIGGAQAVAALAYGTESVPRVDLIVGPGNAYVAAAKRLVAGDVAIDAIAGPSEVLIVADETAAPDLVAADLLAQAEHDTMAWAVLATTSAALAAAVGRELAAQVAQLPRRQVAAAAIAQHGAAVIAPDLAAALAFAERFAPEHLELMIADPRAALDRVRTAGAVFLGSMTPEAAGDYLAGPNHVLPTGGTARFASPLGVYDFVRFQTVLEYGPAALGRHAEDLERLAEVEGLGAHARAVARRVRRVTP